MGPTSGNCSPLRVAFLRSREAKEKLRPALDPGNVDKTMTAPVTAIIAYDLEFYEQFPKLAPKRDGHKIFAGKTDLIAETTLRNGSLQRSEEHTSELQSLMRISYAVFCLKKKTQHNADT